MKWISVCGIGVVLMLAGCKTAEKSQILTAFQNAGGGDVAQATPQGISSFLAQHEDLRKQLTPLCNAQKAKAPADWSTSVSYTHLDVYKRQRIFAAALPGSKAQ